MEGFNKGILLKTWYDSGYSQLFFDNVKVPRRIGWVMRKWVLNHDGRTSSRRLTVGIKQLLRQPKNH
jgi:hypothetical protein